MSESDAAVRLGSRSFRSMAGSAGNTPYMLRAVHAPLQRWLRYCSTVQPPFAVG